MVKKFLFSVFFLAITIMAFADVWPNPEITITYSQNKEYLLKVYPKKYPDDNWKLNFRRQNKKKAVKDSITPCHAVLYHILDSVKIEIWDKPLVNFMSPDKVFVANDGKSVVTIDDWGWRGGRHSMVVYGETGEMVKDFELKDISPFPLEQYLQTFSSIFWCGHAEYLDNDNVKILFINENDEKKERIFNIKNREFE